MTEIYYRGKRIKKVPVPQSNWPPLQIFKRLLRNQWYNVRRLQAGPGKDSAIKYRGVNDNYVYWPHYRYSGNDWIIDIYNDFSVQIKPKKWGKPSFSGTLEKEDILDLAPLLLVMSDDGDSSKIVDEVCERVAQRFKDGLNQF